MSTLTAIVSDIRQHSPGVLPENFHADHLGRLCFIEVASVVDHPENASQWYTPLPEYAVEAVLRDAMVMDARLERGPTGCHWLAYPDPDTYQMFSDADHGGSLGACYAAWKWAKGIA